MKKFCNSFLLCSVIAAAAQLLICSHYKNDNPFDVLYPDENYILKPAWNRLPDTVFLKTPYVLPCTTSRGLDAFDSLTVSGADTGFVSARMRAFDTVELTFKQERDSFVVHVVGVRPNGKIKTDSGGSRTIVNQFRPGIALISPQVVLRGTDTIPVTVSAISESIITVYWRLSGASAVDSVRDTILKKTLRLVVNTANSPLNDTLYVWARTALGVTSLTSICKLAVSGFFPVIRGKQIPDTLSCGDTLRFTVMLDSVASQFKATVTSDDKLYTETSGPYRYAKSVVISMARPIIDTGSVPLTIVLADSSGLSYSIKDTVYFRGTVPALFIKKIWEVPVGMKQFISVVDSHGVAKKYFWKFFSSLDTLFTTDVPSIGKTYAGISVDTVKVYGVNQFGYRGKAVAASISAKNLKYVLSENDSIFPTSVSAGHSSAFGVSIDIPAIFKANVGRYFWSLDSAGVKRSLQNGSADSTIYYKFVDSGNYTLSVVARDSSGDSSNRVEKLVRVHRYGPLCRFMKKIDSTYVNTPDTIRLHYWDTNPDSSGRIIHVYWDRDSDGVPDPGAVSDSVITILYQNVGTFKLRAWVQDNDGIFSPVDSMRIVVRSIQPYRDTLARDTVVLINTPVDLHVSFLSGVGGAPIQQYNWKITGAQVQNFTTNVSTLRDSFWIAGVDTVTVNCFDGWQSSIVPDTFIVTVVPINTRLVVKGLLPDTVWIMQDTAFTVNATSLKPSAPIVRWDISWDNSNVFTQYSASSFKHAFTTPGMHYVKVEVMDQENTLSTIIADSVFVRQGRPVADSITVNASSNALYCLKSQTYTVVGARDTNGSIDSVKFFWKQTDSSILKGAVQFSHAYAVADTGVHIVKALLKDNDGFWSDTVKKTIQIRSYRPVVKSCKSDAPVFINEKRRFTISAIDTVGSIDSFFVKINGGPSRGFKDSTFDTSFAAPGVSIIKVTVKDIWGMVSDTFSQSVTVTANKPFISAVTISGSNSGIFVFDTNKFTFKCKEVQGKVDSVKLAWGAGNLFTDAAKLVADSALFAHAFLTADTAIRSVRIRMIDTFGQFSDSLWPLRVLLGKPVVDSILPKKIWAGIDTPFVVFARDTNGRVDSVLIDWGDGSAPVRKARADQIRHKYSAAQAGVKTIRIVAKDNDGIYSDTVAVLDTVRLGKPLITALTCDTNTLKIFFNDSLAFRVSVLDSNGTVDSVSVDSATGSFGPFQKMTGVPWKFMRLFQAKDTGLQKTIRVRVKDNDGVISDTASLSFIVRRGTPLLRNAQPNDTMVWIGDDTLVCPYRSSLTTISVDPFDTNGSVVKITWDEGNGARVYTDMTPPIINFSGLSIDGHYFFKVTGKDDDSLSTNTLGFWVSPHQPPGVLSSNIDQVSGGRKLSWSGKDPVDSSATLYKIVIKKGAQLVPGDENNAAYIIQDFKRGSQYASGSPSYDFTYTYTPPSSGTYYYQIIAKNSRGQQSRLGGSPNFSY